MNSEETRVINGLFQNIQQIAAQSGPRDAQAEEQINGHMARIPGAAYYLAQTIILQRVALKQAEARIAELERSAGTGQAFTSQPQAPASNAPQVPQRQQSGGGGFLAGAAQTALGISGGILLANAGMALADNLFGESYSADDLFDAYEAGHDEGVLDTLDFADFDTGDLDDFDFDDDW